MELIKEDSGFNRNSSVMAEILVLGGIVLILIYSKKVLDRFPLLTLAFTGVFLLYLWLFEATALGPKVLVTFLILYGFYKRHDAIFMTDGETLDSEKG